MDVRLFATPLAARYSKGEEPFDTSIAIVGGGKHMQNHEFAVQRNQLSAKMSGGFLIRDETNSILKMLSERQQGVQDV